IAGLETTLPPSSAPDGAFEVLLRATSAVLPGLALAAAVVLLIIALADRRPRPSVHRACFLLMLAGLGHVAGTAAAPVDPPALPDAMGRDAPPVLLTGTVVEPPRWRWLPPAWGDDTPQRGLTVLLRAEAVAPSVDRTSVDPKSVDP